MAERTVAARPRLLPYISRETSFREFDFREIFYEYWDDCSQECERIQNTKERLKRVCDNCKKKMRPKQTVPIIVTERLLGLISL